MGKSNKQAPMNEKCSKFIDPDDDFIADPYASGDVLLIFYERYSMRRGTS
jgi:hypothetical protein